MSKFCSNCGAELSANQEVCIKCGVGVKQSQQPVQPQQPFQQPVQPQQQVQYNNPNLNQGQMGYEQKSKMAAGLLGIFLGSLGVHNFYLGYTGKAVAQLLLSLIGWIIFIGPAIAAIWGLVEGIMILTGSINRDAKGVPLKD